MTLSKAAEKKWDALVNAVVEAKAALPVAVDAADHAERVYALDPTEANDRKVREAVEAWNDARARITEAQKAMKAGVT